MQVLAAVTAVSAEAIAKGKLNVPEDDEDEAAREDMDWTAVAQGTGLNFTRDSLALTVQVAAHRPLRPPVPCAPGRSPTPSAPSPHSHLAWSDVLMSIC